MKRIILSRKGFDAKAGGGASPIFSDGRFFSIPIPQDYVNYVKMSWVDQLGVKHIIYPTTLTSNPDSLLPQDFQGIPLQDNFSEDLDATSLTEERWAKANDRIINGWFKK